MPFDPRHCRELLTAGQPPSQNVAEPPTTVITVRLPKPLHEALKLIAHEQHQSLNQFCVEVLWQAAWEQLNDLEHHDD